MATNPAVVTASDRSARSVFVGNIPYEATEEQLKEIFCQVGPVASFRIVYDRESGKPKGYGFCEYQDLETAQSAMRNLNNTDFNGRPLRVGAAAGESNKDENRTMQQAQGGPIQESPYGDPVEPHEAPEAISRAVASLPPEQMYELMKQMKACIQNNPGEARKMLLQNPQLAYALLQAQIVMKIVDPQVALAMLHRDRDSIPAVKTDEAVAGTITSANTSSSTVTPLMSAQPQALTAMNNMNMAGGNMGGMAGPAGGMMPGMGMNPGMNSPMGGMNNPRMQGPMGGMMNNMGMGGMGMGMRGPMGNMPMGNMQNPMGNRMGMGPNMGSPMQGQRPGFGNMGGAQGGPMAGGSMPGAMGAAPRPGGAAATPAAGADQEKAQLIMQVLQLSDEQIAMLPPDQRESILILKQQISKS